MANLSDELDAVNEGEWGSRERFRHVAAILISGEKEVEGRRFKGTSFVSPLIRVGCAIWLTDRAAGKSVSQRTITARGYHKEAAQIIPFALERLLGGLGENAGIIVATNNPNAVQSLHTWARNWRDSPDSKKELNEAKKAWVRLLEYHEKGRLELRGWGQLGGTGAETHLTTLARLEGVENNPQLEKDRPPLTDWKESSLNPGDPFELPTIARPSL